jgi:transcriptional regulator with XRE-family HTH domain
MFWDNYYNLCIQKGISPNRAAKDMNISSGTVTEWKKGRVPQMATVKKVADYFGVTAEQLLNIEKKSGTKIEIPDIIKLISPISEKEINLLIAYRTHADMQSAVDKLLSLSDENNVIVYEAAKSASNHKHQITAISKERWEAIENAPDSDEELL